MSLPEQESSAALAGCVALVPAWQPEQVLITLVEQLLAAGFGAVLLIDDGSEAEHSAIFTACSNERRVVLLTHTVNLGKGRALKTGFDYILSSLPWVEAVVTADADGQHRIEDIVAVAHRLLNSRDAVVLGTRTFVKNVPLRSRFGNRLTRIIFGLITGVRLGDTQTGLRGFPRQMLSQLIVLDGERYEYEMTVLAHVCEHAAPLEVPIETVYFENNRSSHFDPMRDSMRIYFVLVRFYLSALLAAAVDFAGSPSLTRSRKTCSPASPSDVSTRW